MRKKTIKNLFENIFWYLIYLLPVIIFIVVSCRTGVLTSLSDTMQSIGLDILTDNIIFTSLASIFGQNGVVPLFANTALLEILTYFISVFLVHMAVDFLLFIPRIAINWFDTLYGGKE